MITLTTPPSPLSSDHLQRNLGALAARDPDLATRLCLPVDDSHLVPGPDGQIHYHLHLARFPLAVTAPDLEGQLRLLDGDRDVLLFGVGQGDVLSAVLDRLPAPAGEQAIGAPAPTLRAWERDPALLRVALSLRDYTPWLRSRRLRLALGVDLVDILPDRERSLVLRHPLLARVYAREGLLLDQGLRERRALMCEGGLFVDEVGAALREHGYCLYTLDLKKLAVEELALTCQRFAPDLVVAINYTYGLAGLCAEHGCDLLCWEVDFATDNMPRDEPGARRAHVFTYRRAHVADFRAAGFPHVDHLALAADTGKRTPAAPGEIGERYAAPVAFVGMTGLSQAAAYRELFIRAYASFHGGTPAAHADGQRVLDEVLEEQRRDLTAYLVPGLLEARCPAFYQASMRNAGNNPVKLAGDIAACDKRLRYIAALGPLGVRVWGDEGWRQAEGAGVVYQGLAGHHLELNKIYCGAGVNVDVNRLFQQDIVPMRVFDVLACGGFLIAEHSDDLAELFRVGADLETYRTLDELRDKIAYYLAHPDARRAIAAQGLHTVRERHTISQRVRYMLSRVASRSPSPNPSQTVQAASPRPPQAPRHGLD